MEEITDIVFRHFCKKFGADLMYTEFVASEGLIRNVERTIDKMKILEEERPIGIQIYGKDTDAMVEAAKIVEEYKPDLIDINFGCPVKKIANKGGGAGFLKDIPKMIKVAENIVKAVKLPVTCKTRLGWDSKNKNIETIAEQLQDIGIQALTIHGRTKEDMYKGEADWTLIGKIKENPRIKIPIIGNGDINSPQKAKEYLEKYNVDGIMIGRAAIGNPFIFQDIKNCIFEGISPQERTIKEKIDIAEEHYLKYVEQKGENRANKEIRKHFAQYLRGAANIKNLRQKIFLSKTKEEIMGLLEEAKELRIS